MSGGTARFRLGVNGLYLGEKIVQGDDRHFKYHGGFKPETHSPETLLEKICQGHAFCAELLSGDCGLAHHGRWCSRDQNSRSYCPDTGKADHCGRPAGYRVGNHFKSAQHLALDIDSGNPSIEDLLADSFISQHASMIYPTINWTPEGRRWRVFFILTEAISEAEVYRKAATALLDRYDTTDQQVKDPARLFFGMKPGNGEPVFLGNLLPMGEVLKLVSEYEERRRKLDREANARLTPQVDPGKLTGNTGDERYVRRAIEEELAWLASRAPGSGERYPSVIPAVMKLESLCLSDWLSADARAQIDVAAIVLEGCAANGALQHYGEEHLRKAIDWGIAHAEPRTVPASWNQQSASPNERGLDLDPNAEPPFQKFLLLCEAVPKFKRSWDRRRSDLADESALGYEMSLASIALQAKWSDQEITNLLIASRRGHGDDLKLQEDYYRRTMARARGLREQVQDQERLEDAMGVETENRRAAVLEGLSRLFRVRICRVVKFIDDPPTYWMEANGVGISLGEVSGIMEEHKFRFAVAAATGVVIPRLPTKRKAEWDGKAQAVLAACEEVDLGDISHPVQEILALLEDYLGERPPSEDAKQNAASRYPFIKDGHTYILLDNFQIWLDLRRNMKLTLPEIARRFSRADIVSVQLRIDDKRYRCWDVGQNVTPLGT